MRAGVATMAEVVLTSVEHERASDNAVVTPEVNLHVTLIDLTRAIIANVDLSQVAGVSVVGMVFVRTVVSTIGVPVATC